MAPLETERVNKAASLALRALALAFAFLTIIPVRFAGKAPTDGELEASRYGFPCVGLAIGLLIAAFSALLNAVGAPLWPAAAVLLASIVLISGALHLDGLADSADGLCMPRGDVDRRLEVMRDPHVGSFGVAAIGLNLIAKFSALATLTGEARTLAVIAAVTIGRTLILVSAGLASSARHDGTGRVFIQATTERDAICSALGAGALSAALLGLPGLLAAGAALAVTIAVTRFARARLGGITGDILGAVLELSETTLLLILALAQTAPEPTVPSW